jgi:hypothetical protein
MPCAMAQDPTIGKYGVSFIGIGTVDSTSHSTFSSIASPGEYSHDVMRGSTHHFSPGFWTGLYEVLLATFRHGTMACSHPSVYLRPMPCTYLHNHFHVYVISKVYIGTRKSFLRQSTSSFPSNVPQTLTEQFRPRLLLVESGRGETRGEALLAGIDGVAAELLPEQAVKFQSDSAESG